MADIRGMLGVKTPEAAAAPTPKPATSETPAGDEPQEKTPETATETVEEKPTPETTEEEPELPKGVQKKIAQEAEKAARIQSEIDRAVSERKAKEAELEKLTKGEKGSEPVNQPKSPVNERPKRPTLGEAGHETETWDQFQARDDAYQADRETWLKAEAIREFEAKQTAQTAQKAAQERWDSAVAKHGKGFPALMDSARAVAPEGLQVAISHLENWDTVAVHLAKNPAKLQELANSYTQNPTRAIATLGRIEAALSSETKPAATKETPLPAPLKKVGGSASPSGEELQKTLEEGSMSQLRARLGKLRK